MRCDFGGALAIGNAGGDIGDIDGAGGDVLPEAEAAGAGVVAGQVEGDADEPGGDGAVFAEAGAGGPGAQEGLLGEGFGGVAVVQLGEQEAEDARLVEGDDGFEVVERRGARACAEGEACRREGLDVFRHHMHSWPHAELESRCPAISEQLQGQTEADDAEVYGREGIF